MKKRPEDMLNPVIEKMCAALIGVDLVGLFQLISLEHLNRRLSYAAIAFALSLPLLSLALVIRLFNMSLTGEFEQWVAAMGSAGAIIAVCALIFHLSLVAGVTFVILFIGCTIVLFAKLLKASRL